MSNIVIRKSSGWEMDYGKYVVIDNNSLTMESTGSLLDAMRLWIGKFIELHKTLHKYIIC